MKKAEAALRQPAPDAVLVDLAIPIAGSKLIAKNSSYNHLNGGLAFLREAKRVWRRTRFVLITGQPSLDAKQWCQENGAIYAIKPISKSKLENLLHSRPPSAFVVHGRNKPALNKTKAILQKLGIKSVVLMEQPSKGRTVIEKFEEVSSKCDLAVIAISPDDIGYLAGNSLRNAKFRARQNIIFELGYFYGFLGRASGKVILIEFGNTEIPTDIAGIVRIDGTVPKSKLIETLRAEIE